MNRPATLRFDHLLATSERDATARVLRSSGAEVTSWNDVAGHAYAGIEVSGESSIASDPPADAQLFDPPLFVARVTPDAPHVLGRLATALEGPGRPAGVLRVIREPHAVVIEVDPARTPLSLVLATIDLELGPHGGRRIEPLLPVDDQSLAVLCATLLGEPDLDTSRLIETYIEPMLSVSP